MRTWRVSISSYCKPKKWARFIAVSATPVKNRAAKVDTTKLARWKHERKGWRWHRYQRRSFFTKAHIVWTAEGQRPSCIGNVSLLRIVSNLWGYCMLTKQKKKAPLSSTIYIYIYICFSIHMLKLAKKRSVIWYLAVVSEDKQLRLQSYVASAIRLLNTKPMNDIVTE